MRQAAATNPAIDARVKLLEYRVPEEFYDLKKDPSSLHNLIDDPQYQDQANKMARNWESGWSRRAIRC